MSIHGIRIDAIFGKPIEFPEDWLESVYTSLENSMVTVSVDMSADFDSGTLSFLLGIKTFLDNSDNFLDSVSREILEHAFHVADGGFVVPSGQHSFNSQRTLAFA